MVGYGPGDRALKRLYVALRVPSAYLKGLLGAIVPGYADGIQYFSVTLTDMGGNAIEALH